jgi:RHS repeat-associated protein
MKKNSFIGGANKNTTLAKLKQQRRQTTPLRYHPVPIGLRLIAWLIIATQLLPSNVGLLSAATIPAVGQSLPAQPKMADEAKRVIPNRTLPDVKPPSLTPEFSENPSDIEFFHIHLFQLPLTPVLGKTSMQENRDLAGALLAFSKRGKNDDVSMLTTFLDAHPASAWRASLLFNIGKVYRSTGYISRALAIWEKTWDLVKGGDSEEAKTVANVTAGELAELYGRLGRKESVEGMLTELQGRDISGPAAAKLFAVRQGLWTMKNEPEKGFLCGPYALSSVLAARGEKDTFPAVLQQACSTTNGTSLAQLKEWSEQLNMHMQMARREPGAEVPLPAIVNWKAGHFAALLKNGNGRFLMKDPIFEQEMWISEQALDDEGSGYFLVPEGKLPAGWKTVQTEEARLVWGKGPAYLGPLDGQGANAPYCGPPCDPPAGGTGGDPDDGSGNEEDGMAGYQLNALLASIRVLDTPLRYTPPRGYRVHFTVTYDQFDVNLLSGQNFANLGPNFNYNYLSYVINDTNQPTTVNLFMREGGVESYVSLDTGTMNYAMQQDTRAIMHQNSATNFVRTMPNGSTEIFDTAATVSGVYVVLLTKMIDPYGNTNSLTYDSYYRLAAIRDAIGQVSTVSYVSTNASNTVWFYKIAQVTDPFGRSAYFAYNTNSPYQLVQSTDVMGLVSQYAYTNNNYMSALVTPYGTNYFTYLQTVLGAYTNTNSVQVIDPEGNSEMAMFIGVDFLTPVNTGVSSILATELVPTNLSVTPINGLMQYRNTFYWDKNAMKEAPGNFTQARIYHFLHTSTPGVSHILESVKSPLESRIWFNYPGQTIGNYETGITNSSPSRVARILDDGTTQMSQYEYTNLYGKTTKAVDALGRTTLYTYAANGNDLTQVRQVNGANKDILKTITYNTQHLPLTTVDASGQTNTFGYNSYGQLISITNALNQTVTMSYDTNGYLTNVLGSLPGATNAYSYDSFGRVLASTDSSGYTVTYSYDALDRITKITHPDGTYEQIVYDRLDPVLKRDRRGHWTATTYDTLRRVRDIRDSLNRVTHFEWCGCGSLESITDPLGNTTAWTRDIEGRPTVKTFPDTSQIQYTYGVYSGRLASVTDAKNQTTLYSYFADDDLSEVTYSNPVVSTPSVSFTYDTNYNRMLTMVDGTGTTAYSYNPITVPPALGAGQLASVTNPASLGNSVITYQYDALGRVTNRAIDGVAMTMTFDALGRVTNTTNVLGSFTNTYVGATLRLNSVAYPNGQGASFSYFGTNNDLRLQTILNTNSAGSTISKFDYTYDADGQIQTWTRQTDATSTNTFSFQYDPVDQLLGAVLAQTGVATNILSQYLYSYDKSGNRTGQQINTNTTGANFNSLNQLTNLINNGLVQFSGNVTKTSTVSVASVSAVMTNQTNFAANVVTTNGTNQIQITATDLDNNTGVTNYQLIVTNNSVTETLVYDLNGNLTTTTTAAATNSYEWDAANRLTAINEAGTNRSEFTYDGTGRRTQIVEKTNGVAYSTKTFVWCGTELCEERSSTGTTVTKRFFGQGEQISGTNYYFTRDHLGSVREMTDTSGTIHVRYDYDPYGTRTKVSGDMDADFGFTSHYFHQNSGLYLTLYRAYDSTTGRWLSKDSLGEGAAINLYSYVFNNPVRLFDPFGLEGDDSDTKSLSDYYDWAKGLYDKGKELVNQTIDFYSQSAEFNNQINSAEAGASKPVITQQDYSDAEPQFINRFVGVFSQGTLATQSGARLGNTVARDVAPEVAATEDAAQSWSAKLENAANLAERAYQIAQGWFKKPHCPPRNYTNLPPPDNSHDNGPGTIYFAPTK